ncbi:hypothetical protein BDW68DRAFT_95325 [Aspergillus falconensis]
MVIGGVLADLCWCLRGAGRPVCLLKSLHLRFTVDRQPQPSFSRWLTCPCSVNFLPPPFHRAHVRAGSTIFINSNVIDSFSGSLYGVDIALHIVDGPGNHTHSFVGAFDRARFPLAASQRAKSAYPTRARNLISLALIVSFNPLDLAVPTTYPIAALHYG